MVKHDLREQGFSVVEKTNKKSVITLFWVGFTFLMVVGAIFLIISVVGYSSEGSAKSDTSPTASGGWDLDSTEQGFAFLLFYFAELFGSLAIYFTVKFLVTFLVCTDRYNSIKFKLLENNSLPVCHCKEALTVWQTMLIYLFPAVIGYGYMVGWCAYQVYVSSMRATFMLTFMFISFFMAFDLTLAVHVLYMKIKEKVNYISIDRHVFVMTLFKGTYVKFNNKAIRRKYKEIYDDEKSEAKQSKPEKGELAKIFTKMTTCGNPQCENYGMELMELGEGDGLCPICGAKAGQFAYVFTKMKACITPHCENYGQELDANKEVCPACGEQTGRFAFKIKKHLAAPAIIIALSSIAAYALIDWFALGYGIVGPVMDVVFLLKMGITVTSICMGISSKAKPAVIIPIVTVIINGYVGIFLRMVVG